MRLGAGWMRTRELDDEDSKGGLCADQMGLGKTIMASLRRNGRMKLI